MSLLCRYYAPKYPEIDDVVMVKVRSIAEMGAYVHLLEYNNIEGMILLSELSRRRIRSINKLIRVGKTEPVVVIRVDKEKGYIDLSKRRVSPEDVEKCREKYSKAKTVNSLLSDVARRLDYKTDEELEDLYKKTAWHFEEKFKKQSSSASFAYDIFKQAVNDPSLLDECGLDEATKETLLSIIRSKLTQPAVKIRADIEVACFRYEGIGAVKKALKAGIACSTKDIPIKINLISPPLYVMTTETPERQNGLKALEVAIEKVREVIESCGGVFNVHMGPKVETKMDEDELARQMEKAELENAEIGGDDDQSDMEAEGSDGEEEEDTKGADEQ